MYLQHFKNELLIRMRCSQAWLYPLAFFVIVICLFPLAFTPDAAFLQKYIPGCIWVTALLASLLSVENLLASDLEDGYLEQLLLSSHSLTGMIAIKLLAQWLVSELPLILLTPFISLLFDLNSMVTFSLMLSLLFGTPILILIGGLGVALTIGLQRQGAMLSLLILPLVSPILIFGTSICQQAQHNLSILSPLALLAGLSLLAVMTLPWLIGTALRISVDN